MTKKKFDKKTVGYSLLGLCFLGFVGFSNAQATGEQEEVSKQKEYNQEVVDATIELIKSYEEDIECFFDNDKPLKSLCNVIKSPDDLKSVKNKIQTEIDKLKNDYNYTYNSDVMQVQWYEIRNVISGEGNKYNPLNISDSNISNSSDSYNDYRIPLATCKSTDPVSCARRYIKDNYSVKWYTLSDDIQVFQKTTGAKDYVIYMTIKGENVFGATVRSTFVVTVDKDSTYVYNCYIK